MGKDDGKLMYMGNALVSYRRFPMGNGGPGRDDIRRYIRDGWRFRIKTVKGLRYITRRKGQKERSLGPFKPELWALIRRLTAQTAGTEVGAARASARQVIPQFTEKWRSIQEEISKIRGARAKLSV